ncbi:MAG TPA: PEP-CTERM/exosortase system-associated acyltransferase [Alphaproteobacteria bacterium]|nr:PEP-CTERM/exosortase system-associated acyltransferase [Alphaproteobacteria bacterium]
MDLSPSEDAMLGPGAESFRLEEHYFRYFTVKRARTLALRNEGYRLRYQVYCVEHPHLDPGIYPDGREFDAYDEHSDHSLLVHRTTGVTVGTVRLVLPKSVPSHEDLPIAKIAPDFCRWMKANLPVAETAEISRYAVAKSFRRRVGETFYCDVGDSGATGRTDLRVMPYITIGLMRAVLDMSLEHGVTHLCAIMEPALIQLLRRFGIVFTPVGEPVNFYGRRQPCVSTLVELAAGVQQHRPDVWETGAMVGRPAPALAEVGEQVS